MTDCLNKPGMPRRPRRGIPFAIWSVALSTLCALGALGPFGTAAHAQLQFRSIETEHMRVVYYDDAHRYVLPHLARCFENSMSYYRNFFGYSPSEEVTVLLQDFDDYGYAGTSTIPNNYITLGIEPFEYVYETCPTNERFNWVMSHELVHVVVSEKGAGADLFWRSLFAGKVAANAQAPESILYSYLTNPRRYAPRWYHEGIAVFLETWLAGGIGRALGGYDEMVFRTMVHDRAYFYDVVGLESEGTTSDFQIGQNSYLYGTRFMSYLALRYGPEQLINWVNRSDGTRAYYQSDFRRVFGTSLSEEWKRWIEWEHQWQSANLDSICAYPVTYERPLGHRAVGSASRGFFDAETNTFYAAVNYPGDFAHIAAFDLNTRAMRKLCDVQTPALYYVTSLAYDPGSGTLFYTTNNGKHWRDLNAVDVSTGKARRLLSNNRTGDIVFNRADRTIWGVQHHNGKSTIVRFLPPYDTWDAVEDIMVLPYGRDVFDIDISPDGQWLSAAMIEISGATRLIRMSIPDLLAGDAGYDVLYEFTKTAPANFVFSEDSRYLYGTAYQTGVSNIFRYDTETGAMDAVSNCETGYFRPVPIPGDSIIAYRYTAEGLRAVVVPDTTTEDVNAVSYLGNEVVKTWPVVRTWMLGSPLSVNLDSVVTYNGDYNKFRSIQVASIYPVAQSYKDYAAVGVRLNFMDPLGLHGGDITVSVSPAVGSQLKDDERVHASLSYQHFPWTLRSTYNRADFYDFFGPARQSRKGYSVSLSRHDWFIADTPRYLEYTASLAYYGGLEEVPFYQDVPATYDELATFAADLDFSQLRRTIGAVEKEKGYSWNLGVQGNYVNDSYFSKVRGRFDIGIPTFVDHLSLWIRGYAGYSLGDPTDTFANFYFGGFQNNYVDHQEVKRYRDYETFPGVDINTVSGTRYAMGMVEFTLPPWRFERVGIPNLYCTWARAGLFTTGVATNFGEDAPEQRLGNGGVQVDLRLVMFSGLESMLSLGFAGAHEDRGETTTEFMISLKLL